MANRKAIVTQLMQALRETDPKDREAWDAIGNAIVALTGGEKVKTVKAQPKKAVTKRTTKRTKQAKPAKAKPSNVIPMPQPKADTTTERRERPTKWVKGKWELHACGAMCMLDTWQDVLRAVAHLSPEVMVSTKRPDGTWRFKDAVASEVVKLGRPLAASLRSKAQARRAR